MKKIIPVVLSVFVLGMAWPGHAQSSACTKESWRQVAELYAFAACYPDRFVDFVANSKAKYPPGGPWQKCGEQLGNALLNTGTPLADHREIEERAYSVAARAGAPEFGGQVADSMNQSANSPAMMGLYILVIIQSAVRIQAGNAGYYTSTDYYQITLQAWQLAAYAMGIEEMEKFRKVIYEVTVDMLADIGPKIIR